MERFLRILTLVTCVVVVMPPQWCRALPNSPFSCCESCAEELEENSLADESKQEPDEKGHGCQCGKIAFKQPEEVVAAVYVAPQAVLVVAESVSVSIDHSLVVPPTRNLQQLLCCWRN